MFDKLTKLNKVTLDFSNSNQNSFHLFDQLFKPDFVNQIKEVEMKLNKNKLDKIDHLRFDQMPQLTSLKLDISTNPSVDYASLK